ncbi:MAG: hypothetical protein U0Q16_21180 [Bryobacteraceae bacterium]
MSLRVTFHRVALFAAFSALMPAAQIIGDLSDYEVYSNGGVGGSSLGDFGVGDTPEGFGRRGIIRFSLAGLSGATLQSASLSLFLIESRKDQYPAPGIITSSAPYVNPGLGDTVVVHIGDGVPLAAGYTTPSIGNDPGALISGASQPNSPIFTIDVKAAMQQAINAGFAFVTFRVQTAAETDNDGLNDLWFFAAADSGFPSERPAINYALASVNGIPTTPAPAPEPSSLALSVVGLLAAVRWRTRAAR